MPTPAPAPTPQPTAVEREFARQRVARAMTKLLTWSVTSDPRECLPFFGAVGTMLRQTESAAHPIMATDGTHLFYNVAAVQADRFTDAMMTFVLAHEIWHCAALHMFRKPAGCDWHEWNVCTDLSINGQLIAMGVGSPPAGILQDARYHNMSAEEIYRARAREKAAQPPQPPPQPPQPPQDDESDDTSDDTDQDDQSDDTSDDTDTDTDTDTDESDDTDQDNGSSSDTDESDESDTDESDDTDQDGSQPSDDTSDDTDDESDDSGTGDTDQDADESGDGTSDDYTYEPSDSGDGQPTDAPQPGDDLLPAYVPSDDTPDDAPITEAQWTAAIDAAAAVSRKAGTMPGGLQSAIDATSKPRVDWREVMRRFCETVQPTDYTWMRANRRMQSQNLWLPGTHKENMPPILVFMDTSGSCASSHILSEFGSNLTTILHEVRPRTLTVAYADTNVQHVETYEPDDANVTLIAYGGGGTAFQPSFDWLQSDQAADTLTEPPAAIVYLTDGWAMDADTVTPPTTPDGQPIPVLWAVLQGGYTGMPFGEVVELDI